MDMLVQNDGTEQDSITDSFGLIMQNDGREQDSITDSFGLIVLVGASSRRTILSSIFHSSLVRSRCT